MSEPCGSANVERKRLVESSCLFTNQEDAIAKFKIASSDFLNDISERSVCPYCHKSRRYFCYTCYVPVDDVKDKIPRLKLPIKMDIIKHPREVEGKSTSAHAAILAPDDVRVFVYPNVPDYSNEKVLLVFPSKNAVTLQDWWKSHIESVPQCSLQCKEMKKLSCCQLNCSVMKKYDGENSLLDTCEDALTIHEPCCMTQSDSYSCDAKNAVYRKDNLKNVANKLSLSNACKCRLGGNRSLYPFDRAVFIDSTWKQTKRIYGDERIRRLPSVVLTSHKSLFWRHQRAKPENHLATIEAVYYFLVDLHNLAQPDIPYSGQYDNILFFFKFMYNKIRTLYDPSTLRAYRDQALVTM